MNPTRCLFQIQYSFAVLFLHPLVDEFSSDAFLSKKPAIARPYGRANKGPREDA